MMTDRETVRWQDLKDDLRRYCNFSTVRESLYINGALAEQGVALAARMVYLVLNKQANQNRRCWVSQPKIAALAGISERHLQRVIDDLENAGLIITVGRHSRGNYEYEICRLAEYQFARGFDKSGSTGCQGSPDIISGVGGTPRHGVEDMVSPELLNINTKRKEEKRNTAASRHAGQISLDLCQSGKAKRHSAQPVKLRTLTFHDTDAGQVAKHLYGYFTHRQPDANFNPESWESLIEPCLKTKDRETLISLIDVAMADKGNGNFQGWRALLNQSGRDPCNYLFGRPQKIWKVHKNMRNAGRQSKSMRPPTPAESSPGSQFPDTWGLDPNDPNNAESIRLMREAFAGAGEQLV